METFPHPQPKVTENNLEKNAPKKVVRVFLLQPTSVEDIQKIVMQLKDKNIGVLITDHNVQETLSIIQRAYLLFEGKVLKSGTAEELSQDEQVRKVYLGQHFELRRKNIN